MESDIVGVCVCRRQIENAKGDMGLVYDMGEGDKKSIRSEGFTGQVRLVGLCSRHAGQHRHGS